MKRGSKFLIVALSTFAMAGTAVAQGDGGDTGDGTGDATGDGTGDAGTGDAGTGDAGTGDAGTGDATGGDTGGDMGGGDMAAEGGPPGMILDKGKIAIFAALDVNLSTDFVAKPISITPDVWYGVMPKLEVGLAHSGVGINGFWGGGLGGGICPTGEENGCAKVYNGPILIGAHYLLVAGGVDLAADAGVLIDAIDPFTLSAKVGVLGRKVAGKIMIGFNPNIDIGITKRDAGNKEVLNIPVDVKFMATPKLGVGLQLGITGSLDGFGDNFTVPVSLGAMFKLNEKMMAGAAFNLFAPFAGKIGGVDISGFDGRSLTVFFGFHN